MGTLHHPPGHLWRTTLWAALATLLVLALLLIPAGNLEPDGFFGSGSGATDAQPTLSAPPGQGEWPQDPLAFPTVELPPAR
jgi:hypothetical protein